MKYKLSHLAHTLLQFAHLMPSADLSSCEPYNPYYYYFWAHLHKATGLEIRISKTTTTTVYYSVSNVLWKAIAFFF